MNSLKSIFFLLFFCVLSQSCHYSCQTCTNDYYLSCTLCQNNVAPLSLGQLANPTAGPCIQTSSNANPLGIVLLIFCILSTIFLKSQPLIYYMLSFQTLALLGFIEVAYSSSLDTIFDAFSYFMLFTIMGKNQKTSDGILASNGMYRLSDFLVTVNF